MWLFLIVIVVIVFVWLTNKFYIQPRKLYSYYAATLLKLGYKVYVVPFKPFSVPFVQLITRDAQQYRNAYHTYQNTYTQYDIVLDYFVHKININLINPDLIKQFFAHDKLYNYPKYEGVIKGIKILFGQGTAFSEGEAWKNKRKMISKSFNFDFMKESISKICLISDQWLDEIESECKVANNQYRLYFLQYSTRIFNAVMLKCFFGSQQISQKVEGVKFQLFINRLIQEMNEMALSPLVLLLGKKAFDYGLTSKIRQLSRKVEIFDAIGLSLIRKRRQQIQGNQQGSVNCQDIIYSLISEDKRLREENDYMECNDKGILDEFKTFLIAGTDTTAHFFMMMVYYVIDHPQIEKKLRQQIDTFIQGDEDYSYENLKNLTYIDWIQNETTRIYGPGTSIFQRQALNDDKISDILIKQGTLVAFQSICNHYNPLIFDKPHEFIPQRWKDSCNHIHPYSFIGFSSGPRSCIGKQLAHLESKIALIKLFKRFAKLQNEVPASERKMEMKFVYEPQPFMTKLFKNAIP